MYLQTKQELFGLIKESTQSHLYSRGKIHYVFGNPSFVNNFIRKAHFNAIPLVVAQSYLLLLLLWKKVIKIADIRYLSFTIMFSSVISLKKQQICMHEYCISATDRQMLFAFPLFSEITFVIAWCRFRYRT